MHDISVIMSAYNSEKYIEKAIESILDQSFADFEFIIVDDASKDNTLDIIESYQKSDQRIKLLRNKNNLGLTKSLNKALNESQNNYIARMDADDISHPERLETQINYLKDNPEIDILGTSAYNINEQGDILKGRTVPLSCSDIKNTILLANPVIHSSVIMKKSSLNSIDNYNETFKKVQDYELWFRSLANDLIIENLPDKLLYYRVNDEYFNRKSLKYRMTEFKVRLKGYKYLNTPIHKRYGLLIPLILGLTPKFLLKPAYKFMKKFDPR